ncbi:MAG: hypothetical protein J6Z32_02545 [Bacteroidales bacterium]|nr:hypothetical protein [Bacteroidales bacterium]
MDKKLLALLALSALLFSGCDWIREKLDMPTSKQIAEKREKIIAAQKAAVKKDTLKADTLAAPVKKEAGSSTVALVPRSDLDKLYYVIVGAFNNDELVLLSMEKHKGILQEPFAFKLPSGLKLVSIGGYQTLEEARAAHQQALQADPEAWVYKKK